MFRIVKFPKDKLRSGYRDGVHSDRIVSDLEGSKADASVFMYTSVASQSEVVSCRVVLRGIARVESCRVVSCRVERNRSSRIVSCRVECNEIENE